MVIRKKRLKVLLRKWNREFRRAVGGKEPILTDIQIKALQVVRGMVTSPDATLLIAPISGGCYVELDHFYAHFSRTYIHIKNGKFSCYTDLEYSAGDKLVNFFYGKVEEHRKELEYRYDKNTINNLEGALKEIKQYR